MIFGKRFQSRSLAQLLAILFGFALRSRAADPAAAKSPEQNMAAEKLVLRDHWALQSSAKIEGKGEVLSTTGFAPQDGTTLAFLQLWSRHWSRTRRCRTHSSP